LATLFPPELINALGGSPPPAHDRHPPPDLEQAVTVEKGHGRIETRRLSVSRESAAHLNWPGATQLCRIERTRESAGKISREIAYAIPQAMAALRNAMLRLVHNTTGPLAAIRETFAENRCDAIVTVKNGFL
jgi:hypothetical protein